MIWKARLTAGLLLSALLLAGCSREEEERSPENAAASAPVSEATPRVTAPPRALQDREIPLALRGRWGLVPADCTSTHGDAKGLLEVGATTLTFYESRATLQSVSAAAPDRLRGSFAFSGEGQEWTLDVELRAWNDGAQLIRQDRGPDALPGPLTYTRCHE